ncbi:calcium-binding protein [Methylovorus menthalis]|uniref:calcium-binding protein n=1 Tax=Methylovorus menthalis TaxID=1002227 RepID=UPI001E4C6825|nr:calcium-binding protein [Methylovorus menthalis]MCB4812270.1 calcium-binding protein [Methylovorus menthalis]
MAIKIFNPTETTYTGTTSADLIIGNNLGNEIYGLGGNDLILGLGGDDFIDGGEGNNVIDGGTGNDYLQTGSGNDVVLGGEGDDIVEAGDGNNIIDGGSGNDFISSGSGNDLVNGGDGDDQVFAGAGNNVVYGGDGNDSINSLEGDDIIYGGDGNDQILAGDGDDIINGGAGADLITGEGSTAGDESVVGNQYYVTDNDTIQGGEGNDTFLITGEFDGVSVINGGTSELDNEGEEAIYVDVEDDEETGVLSAFNTETGEIEPLTTLAQAEQAETDVRLNIVTRPGSSAISTFGTTVAGYNAVDTIEFNHSGDYDESLEFTGIERIELASGVNITLSAEQLEENGESLSLGELNPGTHIYGVAGGPTESVTIELEYEEAEFEPASTIVGAEEVTYEKAAVEFDDFSVAELFHNVDIIYDASEGEAGSFTRIDGANESAGAHEIVYGSEGVDYATMRLGDDTYYGNGGNDLLIGHGGADHLDGGEGDDIFVIGGFGSGVQGTTSKADDGNPEWIATGAKHDVIIGGEGTDTLRVTTGIGANSQAAGTVVLNDDNFQEMEVVQVGGTVGRLNVENTDLQLLNDHYYFNANGSVSNLSNTLGNNGGTINNVVIDASGVTANGLTFEGNANTQTFIGTTQDDRFVGNGGNDTLTGNDGSDTFVFGKVHTQVVTGASTTVQEYVDTAFNLTGVDTITDFLSGTDFLELNTDQFSSLVGFGAGNFVVGAGATAADANDYLLFDSNTHTLSYDADGNGVGAAINIAVLTGVTSLSVDDIVVV